jgi:hypothetical protein
LVQIRGQHALAASHFLTQSQYNPVPDKIALHLKTMLQYRNLQRKMAVIAGLSLITMALIAGFSYGYAFQRIKNEEFPIAGLWLRCCLAGFLVILALDVLVAWALYYFLRPAGRQEAMLSTWFRLVYAALLGMALYPLMLLLRPESGAGASGSIASHLGLFEEVWSAGLFLFGCHLAVLGRQVFVSGYVPRPFGILILVAAFCYAMSSMLQLLWPEYMHYKEEQIDKIISVPMAAGELAFAIWLLLRGGKRKH